MKRKALSETNYEKIYLKLSEFFEKEYIYIEAKEAYRKAGLNEFHFNNNFIAKALMAERKRDDGLDKEIEIFTSYELIPTEGQDFPCIKRMLGLVLQNFQQQDSALKAYYDAVDWPSCVTKADRFKVYTGTFFNTIFTFFMERAPTGDNREKEAASIIQKVIVKAGKDGQKKNALNKEIGEINRLLMIHNEANPKINVDIKISEFPEIQKNIAFAIDSLEASKSKAVETKVSERTTSFAKKTKEKPPINCCTIC